MHVWQRGEWPKLRWNSGLLLPSLGQARRAQGALLSRMQGLGFPLSRDARVEVLVEEAVQTSAIEGERLDKNSVRSSVARRLGLPEGGLPAPTRHADGVVEMLLDATQNHGKALTAARLKGWQAALFPTGYSGLTPVRVGKWRGAAPMRVVSGPLGREKVHYEAPPGKDVSKEMKEFLSWWKSSLGAEDGLLRAGLAHFYFVMVHPFEDGNGRVARALTDMALAQDEKLSTRYYSLSSQIMKERQDYYGVLERSGKGSVDVTPWLQWFLGCHARAVEGATKLTENVLAKAEFWRRGSQVSMNDRQKKVVNRLLDAGKGGFAGGLTTRKYASMTKTSRVTAYREITDLLDKGILHSNLSKGRSSSYDINWPVVAHSPLKKQ